LINLITSDKLFITITEPKVTSVPKSKPKPKFYSGVDNENKIFLGVFIKKKMKKKQK